MRLPTVEETVLPSKTTLEDVVLVTLCNGAKHFTEIRERCYYSDFDLDEDNCWDIIQGDLKNERTLVKKQETGPCTCKD